MEDGRHLDAEVQNEASEGDEEGKNSKEVSVC